MNRMVEDLPDFLKDQTIEGVDELKGLVRPQRVKVIQKSAETTTLQAWGVGDVIAVPAQVPLIEMPRDPKGNPLPEQAEPMPFVPLLFFREFLEVNDIKTRGTLPMIRRRTFDARSEIAVRSGNPQLRVQTMPDGTKIKYVDALNFLIMPLIETAIGPEPIVMTFSRGGYFQGQHLCSLIKMRKASLFNCIFQVTPVSMTNQQQLSWWGLQPDNPSPEVGQPWVTREQSVRFGELHKELKKAIDEAKLMVDYEPEHDAGSTDASATPAAEQF